MERFGVTLTVEVDPSEDRLQRSSEVVSPLVRMFGRRGMRW